MTSEPHTEPLGVSKIDGLCLPEEYIGYEGGLAVRTPTGTSDLKPRKFGAFLDSVKPSDFQPVDRGSRNGYLSPTYVSLKKYAEEEEIFRVAVGWRTVQLSRGVWIIDHDATIPVHTAAHGENPEFLRDYLNQWHDFKDDLCRKSDLEVVRDD